MRTWHWLLVGAGAYFFTDGFKQIPFLGGKDSNDPVGSRNEVSPKVLEVGEGTVLRPLDDPGLWEDVGQLPYAGPVPHGFGPTGPFIPEWMQRDKDTPLWRDLTMGGGFGIYPGSHVGASSVFGPV